MKMKVLYFIFMLFLISCNDYTPKPKGYSRIDKEAYKLMEFKGAKFSFLYPSNAKIEYLDSEDKSEIWFNIIYPNYNATIYCTYIPSGKQGISKMLDHSYRLAYVHTVKAESISQSQFSDLLGNPIALIYDIKGAVASPVQFYITDNTSNFMRGSLYFDNAINPDSISPVVTYLRDDIVNMIESFKWINNTSK
ncbi:MAG: hypothetical protein LBV71_16975 [Prevotella sp.]|nr:hypothetical protein [Prevotella sp.]